MKRGKRELPRKWNQKGLTALAAVALILCCTVGGTLAWLATSTEEVKNTFAPASVTSYVDESFVNNTKSNVRIQNTGDVDAYIRAAIVVNWADAAGNVYGLAPVPGQDYQLNLDLGNGWKQDGTYYYYTKPVSPNGYTAYLINSCTQLKNAPASGYSLQVTILADAIQADGVKGSTKAVVDAWGVDPKLL